MIIPAQPGWFVSYRIKDIAKSCTLPVVAWWQQTGPKLIPMVMGSNCDDVILVTQRSDIEGSYTLLAPHEAYEYCTTSGNPEKHGPDGDWEAVGFATDSGEDSALYVLWRRPHGG